MKRINYKMVLPATAILIGSLYACKKGYLDRPPLGTLNQEILANNNGVQGLLIGAYSLVDGEGGNSSGQGSAASNWTYGGIGSDDAYKGSVPSDGGSDIFPIETKTITSSNTYLISKWNNYYDAVQRCNDALRLMALATDISPKDHNTIAGEARFLRAHFHFELKKVFGRVPFIDETVVPMFNSSGAVVVGDYAANDKDIWPNIEADFRFAVDSLPENQPQVGRVNKWAAMAYLAKIYLFQDKYAEAKPLLDQVIANGKTSDGKKYALLTNFYSNFNPQQKNSEESIFAAQTSVNDNSSTAWNGQPNGNFGDVLNFPYNGGPGACCGFYNPSKDLADAYKTDANGLPMFDTYFNGPTVNATTLYSGSVDPRLDWTAGRPGVPYLDWGLHPGDAWIRDPASDGHLSPKKNVYAASQKGTYTDVSAYWAPNELVANNVNIIRFSDVLLMAAEAEVEVGTTAKALEYVNMVRARAKNPNGWVYKNSDYDAARAEYKTKTTPAANYNIGLYTAAQFGDQNFARTAVRFERRLELAMEGQRFFDLQRWDNGTGLMANTLNAMYQRDASLVAYKKDTRFIKGVHEIYPIPQSQIDLINNDGVARLKQNPGY